MNLREETLNNVMPNQFYQKLLCENLNLSAKYIPFEKNPYISNLAGGKTSEGNLTKIVNAVGSEKMEIVRPYLSLKNAIKRTGEIYFDARTVATEKEIKDYNNHLDFWERKQGYKINIVDGIATIDSYEKATLDVLGKLLKLSKRGNKGQRELNQKFVLPYMHIMMKRMMEMMNCE